MTVCRASSSGADRNEIRSIGAVTARSSRRRFWSPAQSLGIGRGGRTVMPVERQPYASVASRERGRVQFHPQRRRPLSSRRRSSSRCQPPLAPPSMPASGRNCRCLGDPASPSEDLHASSTTSRHDGLFSVALTQLADTATAAVLDPLFELAFVLRAVFFDGAVAKRMAGKPRTTARQTRGSFM